MDEEGKVDYSKANNQLSRNDLTAGSHSNNNGSSENSSATTSVDNTRRNQSGNDCVFLTGLVGLINQAQTCYLNSLLQTLYMTPEFRNGLYRWEFHGTPDEEKLSIPLQLQCLFAQMQTSDRPVETSGLTRSFGWDSSEVWRQHDIQELCQLLFNALEEELASSYKGELASSQEGELATSSSLISRLYQGTMIDYVKCQGCKSKTTDEEKFLDIPLSLKPFGKDYAYGRVVCGLLKLCLSSIGEMQTLS
jgi:ubiquitin carboxyl-terminal hydrolase 47